jgi:hypothetical protein
VSLVDEWVATREPSAPPSLGSRLRGYPDEGPIEAVLAEAARERLAQALEHTGNVRERAFILLEADALLTYACEAALGADDPEAALHAILASVGR